MNWVFGTLSQLHRLQVMRLFEMNGMSDHVVSLAKTAITMTHDDDAVLATLWSKIFKQELEMGHSEEAYNAMLANPDSSRSADYAQFIALN